LNLKEIAMLSDYFFLLRTSILKFLGMIQPKQFRHMARQSELEHPVACGDFTSWRENRN
jgi:hypothetical protein